MYDGYFKLGEKVFYIHKLKKVFKNSARRNDPNVKVYVLINSVYHLGLFTIRTIPITN